MPVSLETEQKLQATAVCRLGANPLAGNALRCAPYDVGLIARFAFITERGLQKTWFRSFGCVSDMGKKQAIACLFLKLS
jgi:hypothetical protein